MPSPIERLSTKLTVRGGISPASVGTFRLMRKTRDAKWVTLPLLRRSHSSPFA